MRCGLAIIFFWPMLLKMAATDKSRLKSDRRCCLGADHGLHVILRGRIRLTISIAGLFDGA
jgi:hypothetical protein